MLPLRWGEKSHRTQHHSISIEWFALCCIIFVAVVVRGWQLGEGTVTYDEAFSWKLCRTSAEQLVQRTAADVHPPLYYLLLRAWCLAFGFHIDSMRLFSVLCSVLEILTIHFWTKLSYTLESDNIRKGPDNAVWAGLFAAIVIAIHPAHVVAGRTARMYVLGTLFASLSAFALFKLVFAKSASKRSWTTYLFAATGFAYTHNYAWFTLAAQWLLAYFKSLNPFTSLTANIRRARGVLIAPFIVLLLYAPWIPVLLFQVNEVKQDYWIPPVQSLNIKTQIAGWMSGLEKQSLTGELLCLAFLAVIVIRSMKTRAWPRWFLLSQCAAPWLLGVGMSALMGQGIVVLRYLLFAHASLVVIVSLTFFELRRPLLRRLLVVASVIILALQLYHHSRSWSWHNAALANAGKQIQESFSANDAIICSDPALLNKAQLVFAQHGFDQPILFSPAEVSGAVGHVPHLAALSRDELPNVGLAEQTSPFSRVWFLSRWRDRDHSIPHMRQIKQFTEYRGPEDNAVVSLFERLPASTP